MRILVTGGSGFIGSALARACVDRGDEVRILSRRSPSWADASPEIDIVLGDVRDPSTVRAACADVDLIFHLAGCGGVRTSRDFQHAHDCNVGGTLNLLVAAEASSVRRIVYASSSSIYGEGGEEPVTEDRVPSPRGLFAATKLAAEFYCTAWSRLGRIEAVVLRLFNVFGPGQRLGGDQSVILTFAQALLQGTPPRIFGDGLQTRDFVHIDDVVDAHLRATEAASVSGEVFNIGSGIARPLVDVFRDVSRALDISIAPLFEPPAAAEVRNLYASTDKAHRLLGWEPRTRWEQALAAMASSLKG